MELNTFLMSSQLSESRVIAEVAKGAHNRHIAPINNCEEYEELTRTEQ